MFYFTDFKYKDLFFSLIVEGEVFKNVGIFFIVMIENRIFLSIFFFVFLPFFLARYSITMFSIIVILFCCPIITINNYQIQSLKISQNQKKNFNYALYAIMQLLVKINENY